MRITYVTFGTVSPQMDGNLTSTFASARYRVLIPAQYLKEQGHQVQISSIHSGEVTQETIDAVDAELRRLTRQGREIADLDRLRGRDTRCECQGT